VTSDTPRLKEKLSAPCWPAIMDYDQRACGEDIIHDHQGIAIAAA
jgi:hypothetical protein